MDERPDPGRFVLTGSANLQLLQSVSQSLAGRTALLTLLPCSWDEVSLFEAAPKDVFTALWSGGYPALYDRGIPPAEWFGAYVSTYVERDVRQLLNVSDLTAYQTFLRLAAGRTAQLLNLSNLGADTGVTHNTARAWLSVLETTYLLWRLPTFHRTWAKRQVKTPKLVFLDTGLVCYLLGIRDPDQLRLHPLRGAIFETWVVSEVWKALAHRGERPSVSFFRDRKGLEVDLLVEGSRNLWAVECKSGETLPPDCFQGLARLVKLVTQAAADAPREAAPHFARDLRPCVAYAGSARQDRREALVLPWREVASHPWWE